MKELKDLIKWTTAELTDEHIEFWTRFFNHIDSKPNPSLMITHLSNYILK